MCGRYALVTNADLLAELFALTVFPSMLEPRYNIAPTQIAPVVRISSTGERRLDLMHWGLVPHWAKDITGGSRLINARSESAANKPSFRDAFQRRRCLVPADGFYEWKTIGRVKQPYLIRPADGLLFAFAGLWERWRPPEGGDAFESFVIMTTTPNDRVRELHDRMPVILDPDTYERWLDPSVDDAAAVHALLTPCRDERVEVLPVSRHVNKPANDDPLCMARAEAEEPPATLF